MGKIKKKKSADAKSDATHARLTKREQCTRRALWLIGMLAPVAGDLLEEVIAEALKRHKAGTELKTDRAGFVVA